MYTFEENLKKFRSPERAAFEDEIARQERHALDRAAYDKYRSETEAERLIPLSYEDWSKLIPDNDDSAIRYTLTNNRAMLTQLSQVNSERIANQPLDDQELAELGDFDLRYRPNYEMEITQGIIVDMFTRFRARESRFSPSLHLRPVCGFLWTNRLMLSGPHIQLVFDLFLKRGLIALQPESEPEQQRPEGLNEYGVNLQIGDRSPAMEREQRRRDYFEKVMVTHEGVNYTQSALDKLSATEFRRVMGLYGENLPRFSAVIKAS